MVAISHTLTPILATPITPTKHAVLQVQPASDALFRYSYRNLSASHGCMVRPVDIVEGYEAIAQGV